MTDDEKVLDVPAFDMTDAGRQGRPTPAEDTQQSAEAAQTKTAKPTRRGGRKRVAVAKPDTVAAKAVQPQPKPPESTPTPQAATASEEANAKPAAADAPPQRKRSKNPKPNRSRRRSNAAIRSSAAPSPAGAPTRRRRRRPARPATSASVDALAASLIASVENLAEAVKTHTDEVAGLRSHVDDLRTALD